MSDEKSSTTKSRAPLRWPRARARAPPRLFAHEFLLVRFSPSDHAKASTASLDHRSRTRQSATSRIPIGACATSSSRCAAAATPLCRRSRRSGDATRFLCPLQARRRRTAATPPCARRASKLRTTATPTTSALRKWSWPRTGNISASDWRSSFRVSAAGEDRGTCRTRRPDHGQHSKGAHPNESGRSGSTLAKAGPRCVYTHKRTCLASCILLVRSLPPPCSSVFFALSPSLRSTSRHGLTNTTRRAATGSHGNTFSACSPHPSGRRLMTSRVRLRKRGRTSRRAPSE